MVITREDYEKRLDAFVREQYKIANPQPSGMCGTWSWRLQKEREFNALLKAQGITAEKKQKER